MADNENVKAKAKKEGGFSRRFKRIGRWFREMRSELKKVVWPTPKQIAKNTAVVLLCVVVVGVFIWIFDWLAALVVKALINLFS